MPEYVANIALIVNGQQIDDWKTVEEGERAMRKQINLARKTGFINITQRHTVSLDYVVPKDAPEFNFEGIQGGTLTIDYENGKRVTYTDVCTLSVGATRFDGDNEVVRPISFGAGNRIEE